MKTANRKMRLKPASFEMSLNSVDRHYIITDYRSTRTRCEENLHEKYKRLPRLPPSIQAQSIFDRKYYLYYLKPRCPSITLPITAALIPIRSSTYASARIRAFTQRCGYNVIDKRGITVRVSALECQLSIVLQFRYVSK